MQPPELTVPTILLRRILAAVLVVALGASAAAAQTRTLWPFEGFALGADYVLTPIAADLRRQCACVSAAFAEARVLPGWSGKGPGIPLRLPDLDAMIRREVDRERRELRKHGMAVEAGPGDWLNLARLLVIGLEIGSFRGDEAVRAGVLLYLRAAEAEHPDAQAEVGYLHVAGLGVPRSDEWAAYWYGRAALNGSRQGQLALGAMYAMGRGVLQDDVAAVYWFANAQQLRFVADAYACGFGVDQNLTVARQLYEQLAERNDPDAQFQLANMFARACGVQLNDNEAARWYEKAADAGHPDAQIALSHMRRQGVGTVQSPWAAYMWAEVAALRLEGDEALDDALAARAAAEALLTPEERIDAANFAREIVRVGRQ